MEKITIRHIAEATGVSASTVSRIINGKGKYSEATKQAVWSAISAMGYSPNLAAQTLRSNTSSLVGIMIPKQSSEYFSNLCDRIIHEVMQEGYTPLVCVTLYDEEVEAAYCRTLAALNAGAVIYLFKETPVKPEGEEIPAIFVGTAPTESEGAAKILFDVVGGAKQATDELIRAGCRRILYFQSSRFRDGHLGRYLGYQQSLWENGLTVADELNVVADNREEHSVTQMVEDLLNRNVSFDGIFANTVSSAVEATNCLRKFGIRVPEDVKVISLENGPLAEMVSPGISAIEMDAQQTCQSVLEVLNQIIRQRNTQCGTTRIPSVLFARGSTQMGAE